MKPAVITSKSAAKDIEKIKLHHKTIVQGIVNQAAKVAANKQQKATEFQTKQTMQNEIQKAKMTSDTQAKKDAMTFAQKQSELDIKRASMMNT